MELRVVPLDRLVDWPEAHARTGMVLVQPHIELELGQCGYCLKRHLWKAQIQTFRAALELVRKPFTPEVGHSHFLVMPEYSLPSSQFEQCETLALEMLPPNTVCIAGFDAMAPDRWQSLLLGSANGDDTIAHARSLQHDWVNGAVIWAKDREGRLHRFLQAKIRPNPQEQRAGTMYRGDQLLYMTAGSRTFCILLCYDFIAQLDETDVPTCLWRWLQVSTQPRGEHPAPSYLFVLQDNERPDHTNFMDSARVLLTNRGPRFETVLFVNRAGGSGYTCLLCSKGEYPPTGPETSPEDVPRLYRREQVGDSELTRLSFRTGEPGIHRFVYEPRLGLPRHAGSPREPIDYALLHPIRQGQVSTEGLSLHASQHVITDAIGQAAPRAARPQPLTQCEPLLAHLEDRYGLMARELQTLPPGRLHAIFESLLYGCHRTNPDFWEEYPELRSIRWMIEVLYILMAGGIRPVVADVAFPHITADCGEFTLTILAGDGQTRPEYLYGGFLDRCYDRRPHLFILLDHQGTTGARPLRIEQQEARRMGAGGALQPFSFDDGPFGRQPDEERIGAPQLYWYDRRALLDTLWRAPDRSSFLQILMEVFPWRTA